MPFETDPDVMLGKQREVPELAKLEAGWDHELACALWAELVKLDSMAHWIVALEGRWSEYSPFHMLLIAHQPGYDCRFTTTITGDDIEAWMRKQAPVLVEPADIPIRVTQTELAAIMAARRGFSP